jgi:hypothetical protein
MQYTRDRPGVAWVASLKKALVIGGQSLDATGKAFGVLPTEYFDPAALTFSAGPSLHKGRMAHSLSGLPGGALLAAGGWSDPLDASNGSTTDTAECFQPDASGGAFFWADPSPADPTVPVSMRDSRHDQGAAVLADGRVLIVGGKKVEQNGAATYLTHAEIYSP